MNTVFISLFLFATVHCKVDFSERARNFSVELFYYTRAETEGHVVISPFGVWSLLNSVTLGATGNSRNQLIRALFLTKSSSKLIESYKTLTKAVLDPNTSGVSIVSKNFMFLDNSYQIKSNFQNSITSDIGASIEKLNFNNEKAAAERANEIIKESDASVSNVFQSDDFTGSRMILTNVISFKGIWATQFNKSDTTVEPFYDDTNKNEIGKVNMMFLRAPLAYTNIKEMKAHVLELPYGNDGKYCMLILLPYPNIKVTDVYQKLRLTNLPGIFTILQNDTDMYGLDDVNLKLPKFKISTNVVLNKPLNSMGVYDIFDPNFASFGQISDKEIFVSAIIHKANIEVSESGTEATASSSAHYSDRITTPNFYVNRPFLYFMVHKPTTTAIFMGVYSKPSIY